MNDRVAIAISDGVADVRLVRAEKMNALDLAMFRALSEAGERLKTEAGLRAVVLSGEGRAFCAGLDMASFAAMDASAAGAMRDLAARTHGIANLFQHVAWVWREVPVDRKSTRLNSSHSQISYAVFCLKKKKKKKSTER